jgi:acetyl esterase/lipase
MARVALVAAILLALVASIMAALIVGPAPSQTLAFLAIGAGEKSIFIVGIAVLGAVLALFAMQPGTRLVAAIVVLFCVAAMIIGLIPPAQALRLASEQRVDLSLKRYLRARIDTVGPIEAKQTITYATVDGRALGLNVHAPQSRSTEPSRAIVVAHGGGWSAGDKGEASLASERLADQGFVVFDVEYRLAPRPNWKTATGDLKCAIGWVKQHASTADWNIDPKRITLLGRSAGGHLALLAAYTPGDPNLPASCNAPDTTVESVVAYYAPTDLVWGYAHPARARVYDSSEKLRGFVGGPPEATGDLYRLLSPTERVTPAAPRTLLMHGGRDQLIARQHTELLADKLHAAGVRYDTLVIPYAQHGFDFIVGGLSQQIAEAVLLRFLAAPPVASAGSTASAASDAMAPSSRDGGASSGGSPDAASIRADAEMRQNDDK